MTKMEPLVWVRGVSCVTAKDSLAADPHHSAVKRLNHAAKALLIVVLTVSMLALAPVPASAQTPDCVSAESDPDGDGWGWENNQSCRVVEVPAPVDLWVDWKNGRPVLRWEHPTVKPWYYQIYTYAPDGEQLTYAGTATGTSFAGLQPGTDAVVFAVDSRHNKQPSPRVEIEPKINGTEHSYFALIGNKVRVEFDYDLDESLRVELTNLFKEFDPALGVNHPMTKRSVKRQFNSNRNVGWALLGLNNRVMNQGCCGNLQLALPWSMVPRMVYGPGASLYKGRTDSDRAFFDSWSTASPEQRADYLGFDLEQLDKATPFLEAAAANLVVINRYRNQEFRAFTAALTGIALGVFTAGLLPPGTSMFAQGATFGAVSAGTASLIIEGDLADAIEAAAEGAFWGGVGGWVQGATGANRVLGKMLLAAGQAHLKGEDPEKAALAALRGLAVEAIAANITMETLRTETAEALTPVFGSRGAASLVSFATNTSTQIIAELSVLYMLDDSIDLEAEAERIFWAHFAARVGDRTTVLISPINEHIATAVGAAVAAGIVSDWDESTINEAVATSLVPAVSEWVAGELPDGYDLTETIVLAVGETVGGLGDQPNADEIVNRIIDWINEHTGLEIPHR